MMCGFTADSLSVVSVFDGELGVMEKVPVDEPYTGETEVTPSEETQILYTSGKVVNDNIKVNPIPNDWGKITWNGSYILVS